jgi:Phytochelatin synthase
METASAHQYAMRLILALLISLLLAGTASAYLPLPPNMIALDSPQGQSLLFEAKAKTAYWPVSANYETQENQAFCGIASLVIVLNSLGIQAPQPAGFAPYRFFTQDDLFPPGGTTILQADWIEHHGLTLDQLGQIATHFGLNVQLVHATPDGLAQFRTQASQALGTPGQYVIVNFKRAAMKQEGYGHISPLAAYDAKTDSFLIMDVARYKYPPAWVSTRDLYAALNTIDAGNNNLTRGYLILRAAK